LLRKDVADGVDTTSAHLRILATMSHSLTLCSRLGTAAIFLVALATACGSHPPKKGLSEACESANDCAAGQCMQVTDGKTLKQCTVE
jgi:hypothetical protein